MPIQIKPADRIIFALDVPDKEQALSYVSQLDGLVTFYKVGWELFLAEGLGMVRELKAKGLKVFLDLKIQDDVPLLTPLYGEWVILRINRHRQSAQNVRYGAARLQE